MNGTGTASEGSGMGGITVDYMVRCDKHWAISFDRGSE